MPRKNGRVVADALMLGIIDDSEKKSHKMHTHRYHQVVKYFEFFMKEIYD